jgi:hypothetical protein
MKHKLLVIFLLVLTLSLEAQKDSTSIVRNYPPKAFSRETSISNINIYPVPVRENTFSIRSEREMTGVKVTNMIGQDIFKAQYRNPLSTAKVNLGKPARGIYLVTISFNDGTRVVRKIMIENPE